MTSALERRLAAIPTQVLSGLLRGIEKEGLRVRPDAALALTPHPAALGSPLTHPNVTTDFSESQLELITQVHPDADACIAQICELHRIVYRAIGDEAIWDASMPCRLPPEEQIPIGRYGSSNAGRAKTVYRQGLSYRYGRRMQTISGIHYNFSLPEAAWPALAEADRTQGTVDAYRNDAYFALIRNFRRHSWLLLYLFGASPALARCFVDGRPHPLAPLGTDSMYLPHATSLRMGPLGYQSDAQSSLVVSFNDLASYARSLNRGLTQPYPPYEAIGIRDGEHYKQLATTLLQIENEFYGTIRPKRRIRSGERPLHALGERGVEYVEVRCMDIDPFVPVGITASTMRFLDVFLLHCVLSDSPPDSPAELAALSRDRLLTAQRGREPGLELQRSSGAAVTLPRWGGELLDEFDAIAAALDAARGGNGHRAAIADARESLADPLRTPSARVLEAITRDFEGSFIDFALARSLAHRAELSALPLPQATIDQYTRMAAESLDEQRAIEAADDMPFETWRRRYLNQDLLAGAQLR